MSNIVSQIIYKGIDQILSIEKVEDKLCSSIIINELQVDKPSMIARFGSTEIKAILYPKIPGIFKPIFKARFFSNMNTLSGFFPSNEKNIRKFSELMIEDMKLLDILGSWRIEERLLQKNFPSAKIISLNTLEPYLQKDPWTEILKGKKVLVVHPFNDTIESQYFNNRIHLFKDQRVLPEFNSFETIKAVQTIAGNRGKFKDWFEALDYMKGEIDQRDFDVAIIGCGAYGFPLAAHVKRMGKKAVHLGGATQILFGVKGKRWIDREDFKDIINDYFVFPENKDKPQNSNQVEGGCYW
jgi:hypothetical protein